MGLLPAGVAGLLAAGVAGLGYNVDVKGHGMYDVQDSDAACKHHHTDDTAHDYDADVKGYGGYNTDVKGPCVDVNGAPSSPPPAPAAPSRGSPACYSPGARYTPPLGGGGKGGLVVVPHMESRVRRGGGRAGGPGGRAPRLGLRILGV
eukprot:2415488-Pyramimonas_sp.AAC.1